MNKIFYKIIGWIFMVVLLVLAIILLYNIVGGLEKWRGCSACYDEFISAGIAFIISIPVLFLMGKKYLRIGNGHAIKNSLTNTSLTFSILGIILPILIFVFALITLEGSSDDGLGAAIFGIILPLTISGLCFLIAAILLIVNHFKNKNPALKGFSS